MTAFDVTDQGLARARIASAERALVPAVGVMNHIRVNAGLPDANPFPRLRIWRWWPRASRA